MRQDQIALQRRGVFGRDLDAGEFAKAGVHTINRFFTRSGSSDACMGAFNVWPARGIKPDGFFMPVNLRQITQRHRPRR